MSYPQRCDCKDWAENIDKVTAADVFMQCTGRFNGYSGKIFVFCPWCGNRLCVVKTTKLST